MVCRLRGKDARNETGRCDVAEEVLDRLASAPWLVDLDSGWKRKDVFDVLSLGNNELRNYAMHVASRGYAAKEGKGYVDHAVASGLLLFQYVSYWYWLLNKLRGGSAFEDVSGGHDYDLSKIQLWVVDACVAVAYHNAVPSLQSGKVILERIVCLPLIRRIGLTPRAAGIHDAVHRRETPSPPSPGSATAHCEARVRL